MKPRYFKCPNGRRYRIIDRPIDSFTSESSKFHIETLVTSDEVEDMIFNKYYPDGRWEFLQDCRTLLDALETLCLFNRHKIDAIWIQQFETGGDYE